ncbi:MAG TPA: hypothetical protein VMG35_06805 [Bryobacteraceae bacterium]|nr:hypothetical protein [Bryobacteraceae bacterium]
MTREIRSLLSIAGALLPPALRADWLREWQAEFWHWEEPGRSSRRRMWGRALGAFPDAWFLLRHECGIANRVAGMLRSRACPVIALVLLLAAAALATGEFQRGRDLLFHADSADLILVAQPLPFMGGAARIPVAQARAWLGQGSLAIAEVGTWSVERALREGRPVLVCRADAAAQELLAAAPARPQCDRIERAAPGAETFAGVVARLKRGATILVAERELARTARLHKGWLPPAAVSLAALRTASFAPVGLSLFGCVLLSILSVRALTARACMWAVSKIALAFALIAAVWIELAARAPFTQTAGLPGGWSAWLYAWPLLSGSLATWWLRRDARCRCRVCHRALTMPVFVGVPGSCLLESGGTEYVCSEGHGALLAGTVAGQIGGEVWVAW